jgi:cell wall-associated NlpC family hydrolase
MKNLKRFSFTLFMAPILFVGCVSEKTSSIKPEVTKKKVAKIENNQSLSHEDKLLTSAVFGGTISLDDEPILSTQELSLDTKSEWEAFTKEDEILETARKFLGVKYIWAANGPSAFDCSGFTRYVFKKIGISLPRYSGHQANMGKKIKFKNLEKGDLVFFDTDKKFKRRVNHVGIFIGNNKFIHASSAKKKVIITSFSKKKFYKNKFLYARRVIKSNESFALNMNIVKKDSLVFN